MTMKGNYKEDKKGTAQTSNNLFSQCGKQRRDQKKQGAASFVLKMDQIYADVLSLLHRRNADRVERSERTVNIDAKDR